MRRIASKPRPKKCARSSQLRPPLLTKPQPSFVHQRGGLQRLARGFARQAGDGDLLQFGLNHRQ